MLEISGDFDTDLFTIFLAALDSTLDMAVGIEHFLGWNVDVKDEVCVLEVVVDLIPCAFNLLAQMILKVLDFYYALCSIYRC